MNLLIYLKLFIYYLFHIDVSVATHIGDKMFCVNLSHFCVPYFSNRDLITKNNMVNEAIIVIHGILKDAKKMCAHVKKILPQDGQHTILICPQFLTPHDLNKYKLASTTLSWTLEGWNSGDLSNNQNITLSSFSVINNLLIKLADKQTYPNLNKIKIIGFSAGGQFVQHFAALTLIDNNLLKRNIKITYVAISPSSYLYLDAFRPASSDVKSCKNYNQYKYGLENLNPRISCVNADQLLSLYKYKHIVYVVGDHDDSQFNIFLDKSCAANMQGKNRKERLLNYYNHLVDLYGQDILLYQSYYIVKNANHDFVKVFTSDLESTI